MNIDQIEKRRYNMGKGYKLFKVKQNEPGKLFPLYVCADTATPMNVWVPAECGERVEGKVKSKNGYLKFRPGWHLTDAAPYASHIGIKENGVIKYMHPDTVWCEVEYSDQIDYSDTVKEIGTWDGKFHAKYACLDVVPENGFYRYKTSPNMTGEWIIAGAIKVTKILSDEEVRKICLTAGYEPLPRFEPFDWKKYGIAV